VCLERHDILMGDGMAAESGPGTGKEAAPAINVMPLRAGDEPAAKRQPPDLTPRPRSDLCAPLLLGDAALKIHARLLARARELGYTETNEPQLSISADGTVIEAVGINDGTYRYRLPPRTKSLRVASRGYAPVEASPVTGDARRLGVALARLRLAKKTLPLSDDFCVAGFHPLEGAPAARWRWTNGDATIALPPRPAESILEITIHQAWGRYWITPEPRPANKQPEPAQ